MTFNSTDSVGLIMLVLVVVAFFLGRHNGLKTALGIVRSRKSELEQELDRDFPTSAPPVPSVPVPVKNTGPIHQRMAVKTNVAWNELPAQLYIYGGKLLSKESGVAPCFPAFPDGMIVNLVPHDELKRICKEARLFRLACLAGNPGPHSNN